jgi:carboxymethylenebutenolidase
MKNLFMLISLLFIGGGFAPAQDKHCCSETGKCTEETGAGHDYGCCVKSSTEEFASFGADKKFMDMHPQPLPFSFTDGKGKMITFNTPDGKTGNAYEIKADKETNKYLFVFHEWYGLNDYIKKESEDYQKELGNINVLALDLYDGKVAKNNDEASQYVQSVETERAMNIIKGAIDYAGSGAEVGTIGWCFGGGWSLQAGILVGDFGKATVIYYGMPEKDKDKLAKLKAPVLGIFGNQDKWITPEVVSKFEEDMKSLNKQITIKSYDADHGFANPSNPKHDKEATEDARKITIKFLKENMKLE